MADPASMYWIAPKDRPRVAENASVVALEAFIDGAEANLRAWREQLDWLNAVRVERIRQIQAAEWPTKREPS